jgi:hypothetical protein
MSTEFRNRIVEEALKHVGAKEDPPGSNKTVFGEWAEENGGKNGVFWCSNFVSYVTNVASDGYYVLCDGWTHDTGLYSTGCDHVPTVYRWALKNGKFKKGNPIAGDLVLVDTAGKDSPTHIGIVVKVYENDDGVWVKTVEGNLGAKGYVGKLDRLIGDDGPEMIFGFVSVD